MKRSQRPTILIAASGVAMAALFGCKEASQSPPPPPPPPPPSKPAVESPTAGQPSKKVKIVKIEAEKLDGKQRAAAEAFVKGYLERAKAGRFEPLGDQVTPELQKNLDPIRQRQTYAQITRKIGEYKSVEFVEAGRDESAFFTMYRFRGTFSKGEQPEIRVIYNRAGKIGGFWIRAWKEEIGDTGPKKLEAAEVDPQRAALAQELARDLFAKHAAGKFEPLGAEATESIKKLFSPDAQKKGYQFAKEKFGDFTSMKIAEVYREDANKITIFRFRGTFTKSKPEVRVVVDDEGKLAGMWLKPWKDELE